MLELPEKAKQFHTFDGGMDTDTANEYIAPNRARYMLNCRSFSFGNVGVITNVMGNTLISTALPSGTNICINATADEQNNRFFFFVYNSLGYHSIFMYNETTNQVITVLQSITQSNGIDILQFNPKNLILHVDIVDSNLIYWVDGLNKARKFNITKIMDTTPDGYGYDISEDFITAYKQTCVFAPNCFYATDTTRNANNLYANLFKFTQRFHYDDGEISNWSDWSTVPLPTTQSYLGVSNIDNTNNAIRVQVYTGNRLVTKIEIAVKINNNQINAVNEIQTTDFVICQLLDKKQLNIPNSSTYTWTFYNDGSYSTTDQAKINRLYSFLPRVPLCQSFVKNAITYTNFYEGFDNVPINASVNCSFIDLFVPSGTVNQMNNPAFTATFISVAKSKEFTGFLGASLEARYSPTFQFLVGSDVKKGNVYTIYGRNGARDVLDVILGQQPRFTGHNYTFSYTANANDTADTVAAQIKQYLRGIGRPVNNNGGISNETTISGNVSWQYTYLGYLGETQLVWTTSVTPVSYQSLQDNGSSYNLIKYGGVRNYGFVYCDDDGRESLAYTSPTCVVRTPFITEIGLNANGDFKRPVHTITINHQPPIWAKYWKLVRTPDTSKFIWVLIQQVIKYTGQAGDGTYLDLAVGSLPTYNLLHPNSVLAYEFTRGDRLRLILDTGSGNLYSQYYDTEILNYQAETTQIIDSNISVNGTAVVTPSKTVTADQAGFYIQINGYERLIVSVNIGANTYTLDQPVVVSSTSTPGTATTFPNYVLIDRRGTIRITMPTITVLPNSIVEIYTPEPNAVSADYKLFNDFGQKFDIANWGTANAYHIGNKGGAYNQTSSQPCLVDVINGDCYIRNREYPTNTIFPGTQVVVNKAVDPNFSDFYFSDMHDTGRVYPQDIGFGKKHFGSRVRFSNNYIQDTSINGLNDFDSSSRVDYNDPYGDIMRTLFRSAKIYCFKQLKDGWINVNNVITTDATGNSLLVGSQTLLNPMEYYNYEGGVGNNPESVCYNGDFIYHACPLLGVFVEINTSFIYGKQLTDNIRAISTEHFFDKGARDLLGQVLQYNLQLFSGVDRKNAEILWSIQPYIKYLFNGGFNPNIWSTLNDLAPNGSIGVVVTQPANGNVVWNGATGNFEITMNNNFVGNDTFSYKLQKPDLSFTAVKNECISVVNALNRPMGYRQRSASQYCLQTLSVVNDFSFTALYNQPLNSNLTSNTITIGGINGPFPISITGGKYSKNGGAFTNAPGTINIGDTVSVQVTSSTLNSTITSATLSILNKTATFTVTTLGASTATGILVVDIFTNTTLNVSAYVNTPAAVAPYQQLIYHGQNFSPNDGTPAVGCWGIASDINPPQPSRRFEFNIQKLVSTYPSVPSFDIVISGRDVSPGVINGAYVLKSAADSSLVMTGSPGTYLPTSAGTNLGVVNYSNKAIVGGADGTYGLGVGAVIMTFTYNVAAQTITLV